MLDKNTIRTVRALVKSYLPDSSYKAFIFGSRAYGTSRSFSDIDVGVVGPEPMPSKSYVELAAALEDSDLPFRVEVVDFSLASNKFKEKALSRIIEL